MNMLFIVLKTGEGSDTSCHMKKITENHIVQNVLVEKAIYNFIEYIYQMTGGRKKKIIQRLRFSAIVVRRNIIMKETMVMII